HLPLEGPLRDRGQRYRAGNSRAGARGGVAALLSPGKEPSCARQRPGPEPRRGHREAARSEPRDRDCPAGLLCEAHARGSVGQGSVGRPGVARRATRTGNARDSLLGQLKSPLKTPQVTQPPHPPLKAYYAHEGDRRGWVLDLFDRTAGDYDRLERIMALGTGSWYRRRAL